MELSSSHYRARRTLYVLLFVALAVLPPILLQELRPLYAPIYDGVLLWLVGNVWYRFLPVSPLVLLPIAGMLFFLWLAWMLQLRFLNRLQLFCTMKYIRFFPDGGLYRRLKVLQVYWKFAISRLPERYMNHEFLIRAGRIYSPGDVSTYYQKVSRRLIDEWYDDSVLEPDTSTSEDRRAKIAACGAGGAGLLVPSFRCIDVISNESIVAAISLLDNVLISHTEPSKHLQDLFKCYLTRTASRDVSEITPQEIRLLLDSNTAPDRTVLLRMLINAWFDTHDAAISSLIIGYFSSHLKHILLFLRAILESHPDDLITMETSTLDQIDLVGFQRRYLNFVEKSRGMAAAVKSRQLLNEVSHKATRLGAYLSHEPHDERLALLLNMHPELNQFGLRLASKWESLMTAGDHERQAQILAVQRRVLRSHEGPLEDAGYSAHYRSGQTASESSSI